MSESEQNNIESNTEGTNISEQTNETQLVGFAVEPMLNCPHFDQLKVTDLYAIFQDMTKQILKEPCASCKHVGENWVCLTCKGIYCSRYVNKDMAYHAEINKTHNVVFSFSDGSFWCFDCDNYITNPTIKDLQKRFSQVKHGEEKQEQKKEGDEEKEKYLNELIDKFQEMMLQKSEEPNSTQKSDFTYDDLINGLKDVAAQEEGEEIGDNKYNKRQFKKIVFMTGAGISVSAGIPDFRTPGSGLYSQLQKYNLPFPEAIFEINYFKKSPQAFYTLSKEFLTCGSHFTACHYFIAESNRRNRLLMNFSQNIDGLEIEAGLPEQKLVQAHGHFRTAKCVGCQTVADINDFNESAKQDKICYCKKCNTGIVKPDIVFFGESLPPRFFQTIDIVKKADLVFVMGTSLKVYPFAALVDMVDESIPIVLVNRENPGIKRKRFLFLEGEIDDNVEKIMKDVAWEFPEIVRTYPAGTILEDLPKKEKL